MNTDKDSIELPGELIEGLARMDSNVAVLTPAADRRVAEAAQAHFAGRPRTTGRRVPGRPATRRWAMMGTLAASLMVGVLLVKTQYVVEPNDIDGSGAVDILDAFALARMGGAGEAAPTQTEIDAFAGRIVVLDGSPRTL